MKYSSFLLKRFVHTCIFDYCDCFLALPSTTEAPYPLSAPEFEFHSTLANHWLSINDLGRKRIPLISNVWKSATSIRFTYTSVVDLLLFWCRLAFWVVLPDDCGQFLWFDYSFSTNYVNLHVYLTHWTPFCCWVRLRNVKKVMLSRMALVLLFSGLLHVIVLFSLRRPFYCYRMVCQQLSKMLSSVRVFWRLLVEWST